jgi:hypothetical protein
MGPVEVKTGWTDFLNNVEWEKFATLTFKTLPKHPDAIRQIVNRDFIRPITKDSKKQICAVGVFNKLKRDHVHVLMLGTNRFKKSLIEIKNKEIEKYWPHGMSKISDIFSGGAVEYFASNISFWNPDSTEVFYSNWRLIRKRYRVT